MKEAKKGPKSLDNSKEMLSVLRTIESHLASLVYYQNPSRHLGQSLEKYAASAYVEENKIMHDDLRTMIIEELQKLRGN
jgi:hypothetical protein